MNGLKEPCLKEEEKEKWQSGEHTDKTTDCVICTFHPRRFNVSSGTVGKAGKETKGELPLIRMKVRHQTVNILPMDLYQDFIKVRVDDASLNSLYARFEQPQNISTDWFQCLRGCIFGVFCLGGWGGGISKLWYFGAYNMQVASWKVGFFFFFYLCVLTSAKFLTTKCHHQLCVEMPQLMKHHVFLKSLGSDLLCCSTWQQNICSCVWRYISWCVIHVFLE